MYGGLKVDHTLLKKVEKSVKTQVWLQVDSIKFHKVERNERRQIPSLLHTVERGLLFIKIDASQVHLMAWFEKVTLGDGWEWRVQLTQQIQLTNIMAQHYSNA
jgi:hypothetical protein